MAVTLKQVAQSVGVSYQTVWRAIHDGKGILPETRDSVLAAVERLGYRPNRVAGSLRTRRSGTIGLVMLDVRDAHAGEVTLGVEEEASRRGFSVLLANSQDDPAAERKAITTLIERQVDGIILSPAPQGDHHYLRALLPAGLPLVAINRATRGFDCHTVLSRDQDAELAARYLIRHGHRRIASLFGDISSNPLRGRHEAFIAELVRHKVPVKRAWILQSTNNASAARAAVQSLFRGRSRPTALFAASSRLTEGVLYGLRDLGLRHGADVEVVGFDTRYASLLDPPLPVLLQPALEMGRLAVEILSSVLDGTKGVEPEQHHLAVRGPD
jgi:LacI family transcriptional regulator